MNREAQGKTGSLLLSALIVISAATLAYYQFKFLPDIIAEEKKAGEIPREFRPQMNVTINIVPGSFDPNQLENYVPKDALVILGFNNSIIWRNNDTIAHTVTHDPPGTNDTRFNKAAHETNWVQPTQTWVFIFGKPGEYKYHCTPHPWMKAKVIARVPTGPVQNVTATPGPGENATTAPGPGQNATRPGAPATGAPPSGQSQNTLPLLKPALAAAFLFLFLQSFKEVGAVLLLSPPGTALAPVLLFNYYGTGQWMNLAAGAVHYAGSSSRYS